VKLFSGIQ